MDRATIQTGDGNVIDLPVVTGTEGEQALDITRLRGATGLVTLDPGYGNTAEATSAITYINGEEGILRYRGYPVDQLVRESSFLEVCYLLDHGELPSRPEFEAYESGIRGQADLPAGMVDVIRSFPVDSHPMQRLASAMALLGAYFPMRSDPLDSEANQSSIIRLIAAMPALTAWSFRSGRGLPYVESRHDLGYSANFLNMTFGPEGEGFELLERHVRAMEALLLLHADHGQNLSTSAVRLVGSSRAGLYSAISAGILALSGSLHGGANQSVVEMLEDIRAAGGDTRLFLERAKDRSDPFRLMGFGHRVYKNFDPRAQLIKEHARELLEEQGNPLLEIAMRLEAEALSDDFFLERGIYPNVDFYSGIIYRAIGFPSEMFTALFALGRLPGWLAQWREMIEDPKARIKRPRSIYTGDGKRDYVPIADR